MCLNQQSYGERLAKEACWLPATRGSKKDSDRAITPGEEAVHIPAHFASPGPQRKKERNQRWHKQMERYSMFLVRKNQLWKWLYYQTQSTDSMQSLSNYHGIFHRTRTKTFTIHTETQETLNSQSSHDKEEWSWRNQCSWLQIILQCYSHQSMALAQKQKYRQMEQDRKPRNKPMHLWIPYFWQKRQEYTMGQRQLLQ